MGGTTPSGPRTASPSAAPSTPNASWVTHALPASSMFRVVLDTSPTFYDGITFTSYTEEMRFTSICGGSATYIVMTVTYCTDKIAMAYDGYDRYQRATVGAVADKLKAFAFAGTCPIGMYAYALDIIPSITVHRCTWPNRLNRSATLK